MQEVQGVQGVPKRVYSGFIPAPMVYDSSVGDMVPTGVSLSQCPLCGYWMSEKASNSEEQQHDRQCC
jgi:hypothetical protein